MHCLNNKLYGLLCSPYSKVPGCCFVCLFCFFLLVIYQVFFPTRKNIADCFKTITLYSIFGTDGITYFHFPIHTISLHILKTITILLLLYTLSSPSHFASSFYHPFFSTSSSSIFPLYALVK